MGHDEWIKQNIQYDEEQWIYTTFEYNLKTVAYIMWGALGGY